MEQSAARRRLTRRRPEPTVAWEGDRASGTVELAAARLGTTVTLTARSPPGQVAPAQAGEILHHVLAGLGSTSPRFRSRD